MKENSLSWKKKIVSCMTLFSAILIIPFQADAVQFRTGDIDISFDSTFAIGGSIRIEDRDYGLVGKCNQPEFYEDIGIENDPSETTDDSAFLSSIGKGVTPRGAWDSNGDDGNLNFDTGFFSQVIKGTHELNIRKDNYGLFMRGAWLYDHYLMSESDSMRVDIEKNDDIRDNHILAAELLDCFIYGNFNTRSMPLSVRFGSQVINWGEAALIQHGISVANPIDASKIRVAGAEIKDALIPQGSIWATLGLTKSIGIETYYQYEWDETKIDSPGTYFSTNDVVGPGSGYIQLPYAQVPDYHGTDKNNLFDYFVAGRTKDDKPSDNGQFGIKFSWYSNFLNNTEFGLYFSNYHSHTPVLNMYGMNSFSDPQINYRLVYPEDIQLYGISFNADIPFGIACGGELAFRKDEPYGVDVPELVFKAIGADSSSILSSYNTNSQLKASLGWKDIYVSGEEIPGYILLDSFNFNINFTKIFFNILGVDEIVTLLEVAAIKIQDMPDPGTLRLETPGTDRSGNSNYAGAGRWVEGATGNEGYQNASDFCDDFSWGYALVIKATVNDVFKGVNVSPLILLRHDVSGTSPSSVGTFIEDRKQLDLMIYFGWNQNIWGVDLGYTMFTGGKGSTGTSNQLSDRDYISFNLKFSI